MDKVSGSDRPPCRSIMFRTGRDAGAYQNRGGSASRSYILLHDLYHSGCNRWLVQQCNSISTELLRSTIIDVLALFTRIAIPATRERTLRNLVQHNKFNEFKIKNRGNWTETPCQLLTADFETPS